jgi:hypothetical protein
MIDAVAGIARRMMAIFDSSLLDAYDIHHSCGFNVYVSVVTVFHTVSLPITLGSTVRTVLSRVSQAHGYGQICLNLLFSKSHHMPKATQLHPGFPHTGGDQVHKMPLLQAERSTPAACWSLQLWLKQNPIRTPSPAV